MFRKLFIVYCLASLALDATASIVDPGLIKSFSNGKISSNIFVKFKGGNSAPLSISSFSTLSGGDQVSNLVTVLKAYAQSSQSNALKLFRSRYSTSGNQVESLWVTNELYVKGADEALVERLASLPEVDEVHEEKIIPVEAFLPSSSSSDAENQRINGSARNEWNIERIKAHEVWELPGGNQGENVVVANIDTGVSWTHEALRENYREDYGWFDPYERTLKPVDFHGHGTHTMGTMVGSKGIGVAPRAKWIACKGCGEYFCTESSLKRCGQWVLCPTNANGSNPDCTKRPRVVSNSWGGGQGLEFYNGVINAWKAANIIPVFAIGNDGPYCGSAISPGDQDNVISVGSVNSADMISRFSSAGPSIDGKIKPEISAPGELVRSASIWNDTAYATNSGTSMACPHVSGVVALLLSKNSTLTYSDVVRVLTQNTDTNLPNTGRRCGGKSSTDIPNNQYGYGILNARKAMDAV